MSRRRAIPGGPCALPCHRVGCSVTWGVVSTDLPRKHRQNSGGVMRQRVQWAMILLLVLGTVAGIAADSSMLRAEMKNSNRAQTWEFTIPVRYFPGYKVDFNGDTSIDLNDDLG